MNYKEKFQLVPSANYAPNDVESILTHLENVGKKFSDVYFSTGRPISLKVDGEPFTVSSRDLTKDEVDGFLIHLTKDQTAHFHVANGNDIDESCSIKTSERGKFYRYRLNASSFTIPDKGRGCTITIRQISPEPPVLEAINLDEDIAESLMPSQGLVLVCGPTGSGKSTTLAASIRHRALRNEKDENGNFIHKGLIFLTYEDPIEYVHNYKCENGTLIFQASVGERGDVKTFKQGLKNALRRAPNIMLIGEMRDEESVDIGLQICISAHTCISSLHADDVPAVFGRLASYYPAEIQQAKMLQILQSIKVVLVQALVPKIGGGRVMIMEYLKFTDEIINEISDEITRLGLDSLKSIISERVEKYGISKRASTQKALEAGLITELTAKSILK